MDLEGHRSWGLVVGQAEGISVQGRYQISAGTVYCVRESGCRAVDILNGAVSG